MQNQSETQKQGTQIPTKTLRKIAERGQMPTEKQQLIRYLTQRITQAEEALEDTQQLLQKQKAKRQKITQSLVDRTTQLNKLLELDKKSLPEKIKEKLQQILTQAITQKIKVEKQLKDGKQLNYEYKQMFNQLKSLQKQVGQIQQSLIEREQAAKSQIQTHENNLKINQETIKELTHQIQNINHNKQEIQQKYLQLRVAVDRMTDIKIVLNRFFSHADLFDENLNLKQQQIKRPVIKHIEQTKLVVKDGVQKHSKLKPIEKKIQKSYQSNANNNQDDFWNSQVLQNRKPNPKQKLPSFKK